MFFNKLIYKAYAARVFCRFDGNPALRYFGVKDFEGLRSEEASFDGPNNVTLRGAFYYTGEKSTERLIVFDHGMGAGHNAYMREIATIVQHGYTVFSYDHTGCMTSGGNHARGFTSSLPDLDQAICYLKSVGYKVENISVIGHSWGGFATLNIPALHPDLRSCVAISGFVSADAIINQYFPGVLLKKSRRTILLAEDLANPRYLKYDAITGLKDTKVRMLIIHSEDDKTVSYKNNFERMRSSLIDNDNVSYIRLTDRNHNPNYTKSAVALLDRAMQEYTALMKSKPSPEVVAAFRDNRDWWAITEQDMELWDKIFAHLDYSADVAEDEDTAQINAESDISN